jgi:hypothetical protein
MSALRNDRHQDIPEEPPPFGGTWPRLYAAVLAFLAALILLFRAFQWAFAP